MKFAVVLALALACAAAAPVEKEPTKIVRSEFDQQPEGNYVFNFETDDGTARQETGEVKEALDEDNKPHTVVVVRGSYTYVDSEGEPQTITYFADETGFHAEGRTIPVAPVPNQ
ncbi:hypothetical protein JYU34_016433 [Plutella xylostella]|uniref:Uncharacterized protein n=2 Tax=Plutella xylostella TaxID=51655 RepID=A0ABQ7Q2N1_PLUXY|nr:larval cuticle protein 16/17 [Plutella xylostella]KAA0845176.1 chitin-binding domain-containing protein [Enterobacter hormaechei]KAG7299472.1 hypothetical protein JYU34_016433 [Plutella xylostella]CAG9127117.1 unnamed protein product [Plutella xylostella]